MCDIPEVMNARNEDKKRTLELLDPNEWFMEKKLDGFRLLIDADTTGGKQTDLEGYSRAGKAQLLSEKCPRIFADLEDTMPLGRTVLDGELSTADDDFTHVASVMKSLPERARQLQEDTGKYLEYVVFDVLWWDGVDVRGLTQRQRRDILLNNMPTKMNFVGISHAHPLSRETVLEWQASGCEGAILKNVNAPYISGKRPVDTWVKIKAVTDADVVVMGFTDGQGKYAGQVGAIQFGQMRDCDGQCGNVLGRFDCSAGCRGSARRMVLRGQCSGMTDVLRKDITLYPGNYIGRVMVIHHMGIQRDGFRHPQFKWFRADKSPESCEWDIA